MKWYILSVRLFLCIVLCGVGELLRGADLQQQPEEPVRHQIMQFKGQAQGAYSSNSKGQQFYTFPFGGGLRLRVGANVVYCRADGQWQCWEMQRLSQRERLPDSYKQWRTVAFVLLGSSIPFWIGSCCMSDSSLRWTGVGAAGFCMLAGWYAYRQAQNKAALHKAPRYMSLAAQKELQQLMRAAWDNRSEDFVAEKGVSLRDLVLLETVSNEAMVRVMLRQQAGADVQKVNNGFHVNPFLAYLISAQPVRLASLEGEEVEAGRGSRG